MTTITCLTGMTWCACCLHPVARGEPQKSVDIGLGLLVTVCSLCFAAAHPPRLEACAKRARARVKVLIARQPPKGLHS